MRSTSILFVLVSILALFSGAANPSFADWSSQNEEPVVYLRYDVHIDVRQDGLLHVREEQEILFNEAFRTAFAEIPLDYVSEIRNVAVAEGESSYTQVSTTPSSAGTYFVSYEQDSVFVDWMYAETAPGDVRTFTVEYDVIGGLWIYDDGDVLEWRAVPADRSGVPVLSSTVTVSLPPGSEGEEIETFAFGPPYSVTSPDGQVVFTAENAIADGTAFQVMVGFPHGLVEASVQPWQRAEDSADLAYHVPAVEVVLEITAGGAVQVTERQTVAVDAGVLYGGERAIPLAYVDGLTNFAVSEGEAPYVLLGAYDPTCESCAWIEERRGAGRWIQLNRGMGTLIVDEEAAGSILVEWTAPPLVRGEETTFIVCYTAVGALQVTDEAQVLAWTPISGFDVPVSAASVLVDLPPGVAPDEVSVEGGTTATTAEGQLIVRRDGALATEEAWQIRLSLPPGATTAAAPVWQQEMEEVVQEVEAIREAFRQQEIRRARLQLAFGAGGFMLLVAGLLLVGFVWYVWGRDSETSSVPHYLSEPPSDLPPGIVAYLLDEKPTPKGALASLFHLAALGLLRIELSDRLQLARNWEGDLEKGQTIENSDGEAVSIPPHMVLLFNGLREHLGTELTPLSRVTPHLPQLLPPVYYAMGQEATRFFAQLPGEARRRWLVYGQWLVLGSAGLALAAALIYASSLGWVAVVPAVALTVVGAAMIGISRWMPQRSAAGVEEATRWRAFEQYLRNLQQYGKQEDAQRVLDRYFAYAVALDVEKIVLAQAEKMDTRMPTWTRPIVIYGPHSTPGSPPAQEPLRRGPTRLPGEGKSLPGTGGEHGGQEERAAPSLAGMAEALASQLERANTSLTRTLQQAVGDASDTPFEVVWRGARGAGKLTWKATTTSLEIMEAILDEASSGGGSSSYRGSSGGGSSIGRASRGSWGSSRSSSFSGRSSGSRRSGGGGRRGFGR